MSTELESTQIEQSTAVESSQPTRRRPSSGPCNCDELLNSVISNAPIILWAINRKGIITVSEGRELQSLNLNPGEIVGKSVFDLYADYPEILKCIHRAMGGEQFQQTVEVGDVIFDSWYSPIRNVEGEIDGVIGVSTNISEQMDAEKEKRLSDELFATAFHSSPTAVVMTRLEDAKFIDANNSFLNMTGYERHEVIGRTALELKMWVEPKKRKKMVDQLRSNGAIDSSEYQFRTRSGEIRIARASLELVEFDGTPCILTTAEDATEHIQIEQSLQENRERYLTMARVVPVGIFHTDAHGDCLFVNKHWCTVAGIGSEEAMGRGWARAVHPDDRDRISHQWYRTVKLRQTFQADFRMLRPDGSTAYVMVQAEPELDPLGEVTSYVGSMTDISARREVEEELRILNEELESRVDERTEKLQASREQWRSLVENAPDFIMNLDLDGTIQFINQTLPEFSVEQVKGTSVFDYILPETHEAIRQSFEHVKMSGKPRTIEVSGVGPKNSLAWYETRVSPIKKEDKIAGFILVSHDITSRKEMEEEARQRQIELEHVSRVASVGHMASELAHEINQPLAAIANYAAGCSRRIQSGQFSHEEIIEASEEVSKQAKRASEFVRRVRNFVQKRESKIEPVNINEIVQDALAIIKPESVKRKVNILLNLSDSLPLVNADSIQVVHVLVNLLLNAFDAVENLGSHESEVRIETENYTEGFIIISVKDNGVGILPEQIDKLFEPFHTTKNDGLGIGLSISRSIIEAHRGHLWCSPNSDSGTLFQFTLPLYEEEVARAV